LPANSEEAGAFGRKFALGQFGARAEQAVVRPRIVVGEGTIGLNKPGTHCNFLDCLADNLASVQRQAITAGSKSAGRSVRFRYAPADLLLSHTADAA